MTTMRNVFDGPDDDGLSKLSAFFEAGGFFAPDPDTPACNTVIDIPAEATNDGVARSFCCDLPAGHAEDRHRQVTDIENGEAITWTA